MMARRLRRRSNIDPTLGKRLVFAGYDSPMGTWSDASILRLNHPCMHAHCKLPIIHRIYIGAMQLLKVLFITLLFTVPRSRVISGIRISELVTTNYEIL